MKTKIAINAQVPRSGGGAFQYADSLIRVLASLPGDMFEVKVWFSESDWAEALAQQGLASVRYIEAPRKWRRRVVQALWRTWPARVLAPAKAAMALMRRDLGRQMQAWGADVCINVQQSWVPFRGGAKPMAQIAPVHDLMHIYEPHFPEVRGGFKSRQRLFGAMAQSADLIFCESEIGRQQFLESFRAARAERLAVLPLVAPKMLLEAVPRRPATLPETVGSRDFFFYPAQFWLHKNHVRLMQALARCDADMRCVLTGSSDKNGYAAALEAIESLGLSERVHVLGYIGDAELSWLYRNARFMIMPTEFGPTNIPPLEALALDCPVATSDIYGAREQLGAASLYFPPHDVDAIAAAMRVLWQDAGVRDALVAAGRRHAQTWNADVFEARAREVLLDFLLRRRQEAVS